MTTAEVKDTETTAAAVVAEKVKMEDPGKAVGNYIVLWRQETKQAAKVLEVDKQNKKIKYELMSGPDKGKKFQSRYDSSQIVDVYNDDSLIMAVLDT